MQYESYLRSVLIVEGDAEIRRGLQEVFQNASWQVKAAATVLDAVAAIVRKRPQVIVMEVTLDWLANWVVLSHVSETHPYLTPVVILTTYLDEGAALIPAALRAVVLVKATFKKPFDPQDVLKVAEKAALPPFSDRG